MQEGFFGFAILIGYFSISALLAVLAKKVLKMPSEMVRKTCHIIVVMSVVVLLNAFRTWYLAVLVVFVFALAVYPMLALVERYPFYSSFLAERRSGEVKSSMIWVFLMLALLMTVFWGLLGETWKFVIVGAVMAWGFGDAAAALVGKAVGRRTIEHRYVEGKKTVEGTLAMYGVACLAIFVTTMMYDAVPWYLCLAIALFVAPVCALVELFTRRGMDTITVPISAAVAISALVSFFRYLGV